MTPERWARVKRVFGDALQTPEQDRAAWLTEACGSDGGLRAEVEWLLAQDDGTLQSPAQLLMPHAAVALAAGDLLSRYSVEAKLGEGGMGAVYRAYDPQLQRRVALKVLRPEYLSDPERKQRLLREARATSALNHPNIVAVHEVGSDRGMDFIAMEFVEGRPLSDLIPPRGLPLEKALDYAVQIAGGLAKAHAAGVIHRDLKPGNIMLTTEGTVKLLDFGLARRVWWQAGQDGTLTMQGEVVGTPAFMSPEQAEGKPLDARSDIFSFGVVLYRMLTGRQAFSGDSVAGVLAAVLKEEPVLAGEHLPPGLEKIVMRCLRKDPSRRFQHMEDVKVELQEFRAEAESVRQSASVPQARRSKRWPWVAAISVAALAGLVAGDWLHGGSEVDVASHRYWQIGTATHVRRIEEGGGTGAFLPSWSPDAKSIVFSGDGLHLQKLDGTESMRLTRDGLAPFFSPDGSRIYYVTSGRTTRELWSVSVAGGAPELVFSDLGGNVMIDGAAMSRDGKALVLMRHQAGEELSVWVSSPPGAPPRRYPGSPGERRALNRASLRFSPDGSKLLLTLGPEGPGEPVEWWLLRWPPPATAHPGTVRRLFENGNRAASGTSADWLLDSRHLVVAAHEAGEFGGPLWVADTVTGSWQRITSGQSAYTSPRVSGAGRVLFDLTKDEEHAIEIPLDGSPTRRLLSKLRRTQYPSWSPVAAQVVFVSHQQGEPEIRVSSRQEGRDRTVVTQRDFDPAAGRRVFLAPVFSPEGARIAYSCGGAIWVSPAAGGFQTRICDGEYPTWSPDGLWLAFAGRDSGGGPALMKVDIRHPRDVTSIRATAGRMLPRWSPDGKWITVRLKEGFGVVSPDGERVRILRKGALDWGSACGWSRDGSTLFLAYLTAEGRILSAFDTRTWAERRVRNLGRVDFSYLSPYGAGLSQAPDGKSLAASTLSLRFEPWILDGLKAPYSFWEGLFPWRR